LLYPLNIGYNNWSRVAFNDYCIVNNSFDIRKSIWENRKRWFSVRELGFKLVRKNLTCYLANKTLPVSGYGHVTHPHLKSTFEEIWNLHPDVLEQTCVQKFRADNQVNHWLMCAWNQAKGCFAPTHGRGRGYSIGIDLRTIECACEIVKTQSQPQICLNDTGINNVEAENCWMQLAEAFESAFPNKSSFEK